MTISNFCFHDKFRDWRLNPVSFSDFNLLVGQSGAGKTRVLSALWAVREAGIRNTEMLNGCVWQLEINISGKKYQWEAETETIELGDLIAPTQEDHPNGRFRIDRPRLVSESIIDDEGRELVRRNKDKFFFQGKALPKLRGTDSAVSLLQNEKVISPLYQALSNFIVSESPSYALSNLGRLETAEQLSQQYTKLEDLQSARNIPILVKGYILQRNFSKLFKEIIEEFNEVFPTITDVRFDERGKLAPDPLGSSVFSLSLELGLREKGVKKMIVGDRISEGMLRTLIHLLEIALSPSGAVLLVDEFENSLGTNCLPAITDRLLVRSDMQFVLTSHHPYVINNIPWKYWKLVTRKGSVVTVKDASEIPALASASSLEKFTRLLNLEEYEEAIR